MEENKKKNKSLIVLVVVLSICLVSAVGYICYDKFLSEDEIVDNGGEVKEENPALDDAVIEKLHSSLVTSDESNSYGMYFKDNVSIDTITAEKLMPYVLLNYAKENGITFKYDIQCIIEGGQCNPNNKESATGEQIRDYTKKVFGKEINVEFSPNEINPGFNRIGISDKQQFVYDENNDVYYFGFIPATGENQSVYSKFVKSEQNGEYVYIYDTAFVCSYGIGFSCQPYVDGIYGNDRFVGHNSSSSSIVQNGKTNSEYVFENYADKLNNYKHTFKLAEDGKYYWVSSEIVE